MLSKSPHMLPPTYSRSDSGKDRVIKEEGCKIYTSCSAQKKTMLRLGFRWDIYAGCRREFSRGLYDTIRQVETPVKKLGISLAQPSKSLSRPACQPFSDRQVPIALGIESLASYENALLRCDLDIRVYYCRRQSDLTPFTGLDLTRLVLWRPIDLNGIKLPWFPYRSPLSALGRLPASRLCRNFHP